MKAPFHQPNNSPLAVSLLAAAAGAGLVNYLTSLQLHNTSATGTEVTITDGSTSTVLARFYAPASMTAPMANAKRVSSTVAQMCT